MSVEVAGLVSEAFESGFDGGAFALVGDGRLRRLAVRLGDGWLTLRPLEEAVGAVAEHEAGALAHIRVSGGRRLRLEVTLESASDDVLVVSIFEVFHDVSHDLGVDPGLIKDGV